MSVALRKIEGVETVTVSLNEGVADIKLEPGNTLDPETIRKVVRDNGFTPKAAEVRVTGRVTRAGGKWTLAVTGLPVVYELREHPDTNGKLAELEQITSTEVTLSGQLTESDDEPAPDAPRILQFRSVP